MAVAHNHPSGNSEPSETDKKVTQQLGSAGEVMSIWLVNHIVVSADGHYSFRVSGKKLLYDSVTI